MMFLGVIRGPFWEFSQPEGLSSRERKKRNGEEKKAKEGISDLNSSSATRMVASK